MEPFVIQCTTCRARLKVSDPALVGDIVGCPKCESFVQVTPPPGWQPPTPSAIAAAAIVPAAKAAAGASASGTIPLELAQKLGAASAKQPAAQVAAAKAAQAPPPLPASAAAASGLSKVGLSKAAMSKAALSAGGKTAATRATVGSSSLIVPEPVTEPGALAKLLTAARQHYWISAGSLTSLAAIATICWLAFGSKTEVPTATDAPAAEVAVGSDREQRESEPGAKTGADTRKDAAQRTTNESDDTTNSQQPLAAGDAADRADELAGAPGHSASGSEQQPVAGAPAEDESEPTSSFTARKDDPLDPIARALATEPEPLTSTNPGQSPDAATAEVGSTAATSSNGKSSDGMASTAESDTALRARITTHLQDKLPATEFRDVPLAQFLAFLSDFSTVPISIDAESLEQAGKGPKTKITVKLAGETVEAALRTALAKPGLAFRIEPKRLVIIAGAAKP